MLGFRALQGRTVDAADFLVFEGWRDDEPLLANVDDPSAGIG